jgi:ribulose-5-phosphate 4-epimerase/fuculose-1-phosphate aldolase
MDVDQPLRPTLLTKTVADLVCVDEDGFVLAGIGAAKCVNTAGVHVHRELHRARPDIKAACHAHSIHGWEVDWINGREGMVEFWERVGDN